MFAPSRRRRVTGRGITSLADVPIDRFAKVLHLCRYPERCCTICGGDRVRCRHQTCRPSQQTAT